MDNKVTSAEQLVEFNRVHLEQQLGPCDCIALSNTYDYTKSLQYEKIREIDSTYASMKTIKETREASFRSGIQMARCVKEFWPNDKLLNWYYDEIQKGGVTGSYPVSFAICCNALQIKRDRAQLVLLYGFVTSSVGAALRLGMIHHFEGQKVIHKLKPTMEQVAKKYCNKTIKDMWQFAPQMEINQMSHEAMDSKMFIT